METFKTLFTVTCLLIFLMITDSHCLTSSVTSLELLDYKGRQFFHLKKKDGSTTLKGHSNTQVKITQDGPCTGFSTTGTTISDILQDCIELGDAHWYGGPEQYRPFWPFEEATFNDNAYVVKGENYQGIAEPYWLSSKGVYIHVQKGVPLFIDMNHDYSNELCLRAKSVAPYPTTIEPFLNYTICIYENAREAHEHALQNVLGKPSGYPDERMIQHPIWSTWARYKQSVDEATILEFADQIVEHGFNNSQLEIDDKWEDCYGSLAFSQSKFPNPKSLTNSLKTKGFRVTLWLHPFINEGCNPWYDEAVRKGYFVANKDNNETHVSWWNGNAGVIDFTNPEAVNWFSNRLNAMQKESGIDSFKFDAGETSFLPQPPKLNASPRDIPGIYTTDYVNAVSKFGTMIEVRVGEKSQNLPIFVRMMDKDTRWGVDNGLRSLVSSLLQMSIVGYPFILPDMIGGNGYGANPTKELYIRWLQANVFMPTVQYSYTPWDFDDETVEICKKYTELHAQYADRIIQLAAKATQDGTPINPPIWWIDPTDEIAQIISNEFLLGEDLLVAPVLDEGAISRDIYLPKGEWQDELRSERVTGPTWLRDYAVALDELPYFTRVSA